VCENRVLGRICGAKREEMLGGWRTLHNEELRNLYASLLGCKIKEDMDEA
jgi:hypothetical protein